MQMCSRQIYYLLAQDIVKRVNCVARRLRSLPQKYRHLPAQASRFPNGGGLSLKVERILAATEV